MDEQIEKLYSGFITEKDHILTKEAAEKYKELSEQWHKLIKDIPDEEKADYIVFRYLARDFLNLCCKSHFSKGFESGVNVALKLTDKFISTLYDEDDEQDINNND